MSRREPAGRPPAPGPSADHMHDHYVPSPRWVPRAVLALAATCGLLVAGLIVSWVFIYQQQQYIEGRGEQRDRENERLVQQINEAICDLLDQLPEGGLLDGPRDRYGCGPGRPLSEFPADVRSRYEGTPQQPTPTPDPAPPATPTTPPPTGAPAAPRPPRPTPNEPPAGNSPKPAPPPTPGVPLDAVTDTVCDLTGICIPLEDP